MGSLNPFLDSEPDSRSEKPASPKEVPVVSGKYTSWQWALLISSLALYFVTSNVYSIQSSFYPDEAKRRNATGSEYKFVSGVFELVTCIFSPVLGNYISRVGLRCTFNSGLALAAVGVVTFGFLEKVKGTAAFLLFSYGLRIIEAVGYSAVSISIFGFLGLGFPDSIGTVIGLVETVFGASLAIGALIGSLLYNLDGFPLPFEVTGVLIVFFGLTTNFTLCYGWLRKRYEIVSEDVEKDGSLKRLKIRTILNSPAQLKFVVCFVIAAINMSFLQPTLQAHLRQFKVTPMLVTIVFLLYGAVYVVASLIFGLTSDRITGFKSKIIVIVSVLGGLIGFSLIGPAFFIPVKPSLWLTMLSLSIIAISMGALFVIPLKLSIQATRDSGYKNTGEVAAVVSSIWIAGSHLGSFVGTTLSGILRDNVGFANASLLVIILDIVLAILLVVYLCLEQKSPAESPPEAALLIPPPTEKGEKARAGHGATYNSL